MTDRFELHHARNWITGIRRSAGEAVEAPVAVAEPAFKIL
jgi:hypothetical protein